MPSTGPKFQGPDIRITVPLSGTVDYTANRFKAISLNGVIVSTAGSVGGVLLNKAKAGSFSAEIGAWGIFPVLVSADASTNPISVGDPLTTDTDGTFKKAITVGNAIVGTALEAASSGGRLIQAHINAFSQLKK